MISIVIPLYNKEKYIERAIKSVLLQTFQNFEIIIINDGSTDNSTEIIQKINCPKIHLINQKNQGVSAARNRGIQEAKFKFIAFLDADDEWERNHLETIVYLINKYPTCGVYATSYYFTKEKHEKLTPRVFGKYSFNTEDGILDNYFELCSGTHFPFNMSSFAVRKDIINKINGFPIGIPSGEDIITLAKLYCICDFAYSLKTTSIYYIINEGKNERPITKKDPLNNEFDLLLTTAYHRKGVKRFVSSWHKRRMVGALQYKSYKLALKEFIIAFKLCPLQKKLYTSLIISIISSLFKTDLYTINKYLKHKE